MTTARTMTRETQVPVATNIRVSHTITTGCIGPTKLVSQYVTDKPIGEVLDFFASYPNKIPRMALNGFDQIGDYESFGDKPTDTIFVSVTVNGGEVDFKVSPRLADFLDPNVEGYPAYPDSQWD